jgi:hypothetical protein
MFLHILYADDIMVFCKGTNSNIQVLYQLFSDYARALGQIINKSVLFAGAMSQHRLSHFAHLLGFKIGSCLLLIWESPFLGVSQKSLIFSLLWIELKPSSQLGKPLCYLLQEESN